MPPSVVLEEKVYQCSDDMTCDCPMLLCTGQKDCQNEDLKTKCKLEKPYEKIDKQNAHRSFFTKGDCKCQAA